VFLVCAMASQDLVLDLLNENDNLKEKNKQLQIVVNNTARDNEERNDRVKLIEKEFRKCLKDKENMERHINKLEKELKLSSEFKKFKNLWIETINKSKKGPVIDSSLFKAHKCIEFPSYGGKLTTIKKYIESAYDNKYTVGETLSDGSCFFASAFYASEVLNGNKDEYDLNTIKIDKSFIDKIMDLRSIVCDYMTAKINNIKDVYGNEVEIGNERNREMVTWEEYIYKLRGHGTWVENDMTIMFTSTILNRDIYVYQYEWNQLQRKNCIFSRRVATAKNPFTQFDGNTIEPPIVLARSDIHYQAIVPTNLKRKR